MSTLLQRLNARLPFTKSERIIIAIVLVLHALPALEFIHIDTRPPKADDDRVMANLVSPSPAKSQEAPAAPKAPPPKPKEESKKKTYSNTGYQQKLQDDTKYNQTNLNDSSSASKADNTDSKPQTATQGITRTEINYASLIVAYHPEPDSFYPSFSKRSGEEGRVEIRLYISEDGYVESNEIIKSSGYANLDRAALQMSKLIRYKTVLSDGSPLRRCSTLYGAKFQLRN
jgi:protein TonB